MAAWIVELTRGHVIVEIDGATIRVEGEAYLRGHGSPDFVLYRNAMAVVGGKPGILHEEGGRERILATVVDCLREQGMTAEIE